jgi:hypothetical protein
MVLLRQPAHVSGAKAHGGQIMEAPLNLTAARGPSVWNKPRTIEEPLRAAAAATGFLLLSAGFPYRSRTARMTGALGLIGLVLGMRCEQRVPAAVVSMRKWLSGQEKVEATMDRTLEESFPASDPPAR